MLTGLTTPLRTPATGITKAIAAVVCSLASSCKDYLANRIEWLFSSDHTILAHSNAVTHAIVVGEQEAHLYVISPKLDCNAALSDIRNVPI